MGLTSEGLTPGPVFCSPSTSPAPTVIIYGVLTRALPRFVSVEELSSSPDNPGQSATDARQASARLGQSGSDPLLPQLLRCLGFCSFLVMIALSLAVVPRRERRGVRMSVAGALPHEELTSP